MCIRDQIEDFLVADMSKVLIVTGSAGTGKTTLIKEIISHLNDNETTYYLLAPTGRASNILQNHVINTSHVTPTTIHSFLYKKEQESVNNIPEILTFSIKEEKIDENSVIIIDEASMLSHEVTSEKGFLQFGSGNLFKDLTDYLNLSNSKYKLILLGDPCQLPPINVTSAEVLNPEYLKTQLNITNVEHLHLTEVHRQLEESLILKSAIALRKSLEKKEFIQVPIQTDQFEVHTLTMEDALDKYIWDYGNNSIFVSYTNKDVHNINLKFRDLLHLNPIKLETKERLILMKNSWVNSQYLYNGDFLIIEDIGEIESFHITFKLKDGQVHSTELTFQNLELRKENEYRSFKCKILLNKLWTEESSFDLNDLRALIVHFQTRHPNLKRGSDEYKQAIQKDLYINALYVRFGYAMTCHKAQGGEWENVFINLDRPRNDLKTINGFKWFYTALTRAKKNVYLINCPLNKSNFDPQSPFSNLINEIETQLNSVGFQLISSKPLEYELQLFIQKDNVKSSFKIYRNKKMQVTRLMPMQTSAHSEQLEALLNNFINTSLVEK